MKRTNPATEMLQLEKDIEEYEKAIDANQADVDFYQDELDEAEYRLSNSIRLRDSAQWKLDQLIGKYGHVLLGVSAEEYKRQKEQEEIDEAARKRQKKLLIKRYGTETPDSIRDYFMVSGGA